MFGVEGASLSGVIGSPVRELANRQFLAMTEGLREPILDYLCRHRDVQKFTHDMKSKITGMSGGSSIEGPMRKLNISPEFKL